MGEKESGVNVTESVSAMTATPTANQGCGEVGGQRVLTVDCADVLEGVATLRHHRHTTPIDHRTDASSNSSINSPFS